MQVDLQLSESGRILRLVFGERTVAEILVHGSLKRVVSNIEAGVPIKPGLPNIFRGELHQLAGYEILDVAKEEIREKI